MLTLDQTVFSGNGNIGDCFRACVACLVERSVEDVPHFCDVDEGEDWFVGFEKWLQRRGLFSIEVSLEGQNIMAQSAGTYCIVSGPGPRGVMHSVIGKTSEDPRQPGFELVHDPHPSREFFGGKEPTWVMFIGKAAA